MDGLWIHEMLSLLAVQKVNYHFISLTFRSQPVRTRRQHHQLHRHDSSLLLARLGLPHSYAANKLHFTAFSVVSCDSFSSEVVTQDLFV